MISETPKPEHRSTIAKCCAVLALSLCSAGLQAAPVACQYGELTRSVEVIYTTPGQPLPCEVLYDKPAEGGSSTLWRAQSEAGYCEARAVEFVAKLTDMGWQCNTVQETETPDAETE